MRQTTEYDKHTEIELEENDTQQTYLSTIGRDCRDTFFFRRHYHPQMEILFCFSGELTVLCEEEVTVSAGEVLFLSPMTIHGYRAEHPVSFCVFVLANQPFADIGGIDAICTGMQYYRISDSQAMLESLADRVLACRAEKDTELMLCYLRILMIHLTRGIHRAYPTLSAPDGKRSGLLKEIMVFIQTHYRETITLSQVAQAVHSNPSTVSRLIHNYLHTSFCDLLNHYRLMEASRLLIETRETVLSVSEAVGFHAVNTFNRNFRAKYGISPTEYQRQNR